MIPILHRVSSYLPQVCGERSLILLSFLVACLAGGGLAARGSILRVSQEGAQDAQVEKSLKALQERIEASRARPLDRRLPLVEELTAIQTEKAREVSLVLLQTEKLVALRLLLLSHVSAAPQAGPVMLRELESGPLDTRELAASWFLEKKGRDGLELLTVLYDEKDNPTLHVAILRALGKEGSRKSLAAFAPRFERLGEVHKSSVLRVLRGKRARILTETRRACLQSQLDSLRGEALLQLVQEGDREAIALLPKLARSQGSMALAERLLDALFLRSEPSDFVLASELLRRSDGLRTKFKYRIPALVQQPAVVAWACGAGARHSKVAVRILALDLLCAIPGPRSSAALILLTKDKRKDLRVKALLALSVRGDKSVVGDLWELLEKGSQDERCDALLALDRLLRDDPAWLEKLLAFTEKGTSALRFVALDLGSRHGLRPLLDLLPGLLASSDWRLRSAGYMVASRVRDARSVPLLIKAIQKESGRTEYECGRALQSLTRYYCRNAEDWERWWEKNQEGFVLPPPAPADPDLAKKNKGSTTAEFYGIPIHSHRVVFVLDVSGSMNEVFGTGTTRIKVARESLKTALKKVDKDCIVNVIFFDSKVRSYAKKGVPIQRKGELEKLLAYVDKARPLGGTNIHGALLAAFEDPRVDTVFLLSDGDPSAGEITDVQDLGDDIQRKNRSRRIRIHCVAVGLESPLLERLARESDGRYVKY